MDGVLVAVIRDGVPRLDFDTLSQRIHPAASRVNMLAETTPAVFVAFDLLALGDEDLMEAPFAERRRRLDTLDGVRRTPITTDLATARRWFDMFEGAGLDGLVAKPADIPYV